LKKQAAESVHAEAKKAFERGERTGVINHARNHGLIQ
jgi:hypothetical protein